jgi:chromosome segregation ATPase
VNESAPHVDAVLGEIRASLAHLEAEVAKLRDWRHAMADKFAALTHIPELLVGLQTELRGLREQVAALQREQARQEGARLAAEQARGERERERERMGAWIRWGLPAVWAAIASVITWITAHRWGQGQ